MVQDNYSSARPKDSEPKNLDLYTWVSDNSSIKLFVFSLLALTLASLFFIYSSSAPIPFYCNKNGGPVIVDQPQRLNYPELQLGSVQPVLDQSSPFSKFHSEKWIVVSVSDYPTKPLEKLVKIKGWQVLAIGNSKTPKDWDLKGSIFLSLEMQADLGFRVVDYLPYDSYVRKNVGYLFAIQHGAKMIYDGDDRGEVIGGDLGKHFDLNLDDESAKKQRILRYTNKVSNRTVVNPYIHFGQRSVWPRGLPLENVGMVNHEEFYEEVFGGTQYKYIQQGVCNGLPDVDSVFYSTRKSGSSEKFDISFDGLAPKVALGQGLMVPLNSFNTLFHYDAFWALMLPVSVSTMASDVMRGYFAQRLLRELDGFVVVYGPTIYRHDDVETYPFLEEKDLHVNVGQMIDFLVSWRSEKRTFYEKILDLSFSIAEKEFWNENDVKLTAAWLHDLLSVGYQDQIKKAAVNVVEVEKVIKKEYIPTKLPSIHLGIKETETVNYEIGNLIRWRKHFGNVVLIMFISGNVQHTALEWRLLYGRIFKTVVILSNLADGDLAVENGDVDQVYKYLPKIFRRFDKADGFLYLHDNTILNYWNLLQTDKSKLWIANKVPTSRTGIDQDVTWFSNQAETVNSVVSAMPAHLQVNYKQNNPNHHQNLALCGSEIFYIPQHFLQDYIDLVDLVGNRQIHHKIAIPMFFMAMDSAVNFDPVLNKMIYDTQSSVITSGLTYYSANVPAVHPCNVSSEYDFVKLIRLMSAGDPLLLELV